MPRSTTPAPDLGGFSISLAVADLAASRAFYEAFGFRAVEGGLEADDWVVLRSGEATIGLFHGMFDTNILTFNPTDVRAVQAVLDDVGVELTRRAEPGTDRTSATLVDPDGNPILLDQHYHRGLTAWHDREVERLRALRDYATRRLEALGAS